MAVLVRAGAIDRSRATGVTGGPAVVPLQAWLRRLRRWVLESSFVADADAVDGRATGARC